MYSTVCVMVEELRIQTTRNKIINDFDTVYNVHGRTVCQFARAQYYAVNDFT